jgi:aerobic carbon-monoxide dehydrogenase small subunit
MIIGFILNGDDVSAKADPEDRLIDLLREQFRLFGAKAGCYAGKCGSCSVLLNGRVVPSCMVPVFAARSTEIITIEGFVQTVDYLDIEKGFRKAGIETCGYCASAKILTAHALLETNPDPDIEAIRTAFSGIVCRCNEFNGLSQAVRESAIARQRRIYGR